MGDGGVGLKDRLLQAKVKGFKKQSCMWAVGGRGGQSVAWGGFFTTTGWERPGWTWLPTIALLAWVVHLLHISVKSNKFKLNKRREKRKLGTTNNQEGRLQHRSRPSCDDETPRTGEGLKLLTLMWVLMTVTWLRFLIKWLYLRYVF